MWFFVRRRKQLGRRGEVIRPYCFPQLLRPPHAGRGMVGSPGCVPCVLFLPHPLSSRPGDKQPVDPDPRAGGEGTCRFGPPKETGRWKQPLPTLKITSLDYEHQSVSARHTHLSALLSPSLFTFGHVKNVQTGLLIKTYSGKILRCPRLQRGRWRRMYFRGETHCAA